MRRKIEYLVLHCTATPEGRALTGPDILRMHTSPVAQGGRGWKVAGYHRLVRIDGRIDILHNYNQDNWLDPREITNGVQGLNHRSIHIAYVGGVDAKLKPKDTRTKAQLQALETFVKAFIKTYPNIKVAGHNQFAAKACPSFDTVNWLTSIGIPAKNIYEK